MLQVYSLKNKASKRARMIRIATIIQNNNENLKNISPNQNKSGLYKKANLKKLMNKIKSLEAQISQI